MANPAKAGFPLIGVIFLLLAIMKFINGGNWVVWAILGFLFGGFGVFASFRSGGTKS